MIIIVSIVGALVCPEASFGWCLVPRVILVKVFDAGVHVVCLFRLGLYSTCIGQPGPDYRRFLWNSTTSWLPLPNTIQTLILLVLLLGSTCHLVHLYWQAPITRMMAKNTLRRSIVGMGWMTNAVKATPLLKWALQTRNPYWVLQGPFMLSRLILVSFFVTPSKQGVEVLGGDTKASIWFNVVKYVLSLWCLSRVCIHTILDL